MSSTIAASHSATWRLIWKELRQYRAVVLYLLLAGLFAQVVWGAWWNNSEFAVLIAASVFPVLCVWAIAATTFCTEHESGSFLLLNSLPAARGQIFFAKLAAAVGCSLGLSVVFWAVSYLLTAGRFTGTAVELLDSERLVWVGESVFILAEVLIYSVFWSLIDRRPLFALVAAILTAIVIRWLAVSAGSLVYADLYYEWWESAVEYGIRLAGLTMGLAGIAVALPRWFRDERWTWQTEGLAESRSHRSLVASDVRTGVWKRLFWLQHRCFTWSAVSLLLGVVLFAVLFASVEVQWIDDWRVSPFLELITFVAVALCGSTSFRAANERREFLANMGVRGRYIWSTQLIGPGLAASLILGFLTYAGWNKWQWLGEYTIWLIWFAGIAVFGWGQLMSLFSRSTLIALAITVLMSCVFILPFATFVHVSFGTVWFHLFTVAVVLYPFAESLIRSNSWLIDPNRRRVWWWFVRIGIHAILFCGLLWESTTRIPYQSQWRVVAELGGGELTNVENVAGIRELQQQLTRNYQIALSERFPDSMFSNQRLTTEDKRNIALSWAQNSRAELLYLLDCQTDYLLLRYWQQSELDLARMESVSTKMLFDRFLQASLVDCIEQHDSVLAQRIILKFPSQVEPNLVARWAWLQENEPATIRGQASQLESTFDPVSEALSEFAPNTAASKQVNSQTQLKSTLLPRWVSTTIAASSQERGIRQSLNELRGELETIERKLLDGSPFYQQVADLVQQSPQPLSQPPLLHALSPFAYVVAHRRAIVLQLQTIAWIKEHQGAAPSSLSEVVDTKNEWSLDPFTGQPFVYQTNVSLTVEAAQTRNSLWCNKTTTTFIYSPGSIGLFHIHKLLRGLPTNPSSTTGSSRVRWGYEDREYVFRIADAPPGGRWDRKLDPSEGQGIVYPVIFAE